MLSWQEQAEHGWRARELLQIRLQQLRAVADQSLACLHKLASLASLQNLVGLVCTNFRRLKASPTAPSYSCHMCINVFYNDKMHIWPVHPPGGAAIKTWECL